MKRDLEEVKEDEQVARQPAWVAKAERVEEKWVHLQRKKH